VGCVSSFPASSSSWASRRSSLPATLPSGSKQQLPELAPLSRRSLCRLRWKRASQGRPNRIRWIAYLVLGAAAAATVGPFLVLIILACGLAEVVTKLLKDRKAPGTLGLFPVAVVHAVTVGGLGGLAWVAFKVGALSYGGGFVIIPLMQHDAVVTYHWMTGAQFLNAVALGQVTPGPVVQTVAVVGYAAAGVGGGLLAALIAFTPSFLFVLLGGPHFDRLRQSDAIQAFLTGAGAASIGAIAGSAIPLARALSHLWQLGVLGLALLWFVALRKNVVVGLIGAAVLGVAVGWAGAPVSR
jgi:chromate transporter